MKLEKQQTRIYLITAAVTAFVIILVAGYTTSQHILNMTVHRRAILEMHNVLTSLERIEISVARGESLNRAYLLTGKDECKRQYEAEKKKIRETIDVVTTSLANNANQAKMMSRLQQCIEEKLKRMEESSSSKISQVEVREIILSDLEHSHEKDEISTLLERIEASLESTIFEQAAILESAVADLIQLILALCATALSVFLTTFIYVDASEVARLKKHARQQLFYRISQALAEPLALADCIRQILKLFCSVFEWTCGVFWIPEGEYHIRCYDFYGNEASGKLEATTRLLVLERGEGLAGASWSKGAPISVNFPATPDGTARGDVLAQENMRSGFALPLFLGEQLVGVFEFFSRRRESMDDAGLSDFAAAGGDIAQFVRRKETEERLACSLAELESSSGVLESVLKNMGSGVVVADNTGRFLSFNDLAVELLGAGPMMDLPLEQWPEAYGVYSGEDSELFEYKQLPLVKALRGEPSDNVVLFCKNKSRPNGVWISANGRPIFNSAGDVIAGVVVMEDVSLRREAEKRVSEFYSTVSHELRTPLTSIRGALGLMEGGKAGELSDRAESLVSIANVECDRLIRLINDILDIRKIEAGKVELKLESISPAELVNQSVQSMIGFANQHGIALETSFAKDENIQGDRDRLIQVLTNLISNAVKFSDRGTKVLISTGVGSGVMRFAVSDSGPGISERNQRKLFRFFQQLDSSDIRQQGGTGLGLAISKGLVEQHGGAIGLESVEGQGSTFWFEIPLSSAKENIEE